MNFSSNLFPYFFNMDRHSTELEFSGFVPNQRTNQNTGSNINNNSNMANINNQDLEEAIGNREYIKHICDGHIESWPNEKRTMSKVGLKHKRVDLYDNQKRLDELDIIVLRALKKTGMNPKREITASLNFRNKISKLLIEIEEVEIKVDKKTNPKDSTFKIPKLEIAKFSGIIIEWPYFWSTFSSIIDKVELDNAHKLNYLLQNLIGEPLNLVTRCGLHDFNAVIKLLKTKYEKPEIVKDELIKESINWKSADYTFEDVTRLQTDILKTHRALSQCEDLSWEHFFSHCVFRAFPDKLKERVKRAIHSQQKKTFRHRCGFLGVRTRIE